MSLDYGLGLEGDAGEHVAMGHARVRGVLRKDQLRCHYVALQGRGGGLRQAAIVGSQDKSCAIAGGGDGEVGEGGATMAPRLRCCSRQAHVARLHRDNHCVALVVYVGDGIVVAGFDYGLGREGLAGDDVAIGGRPVGGQGGEGDLGGEGIGGQCRALAAEVTACRLQCKGGRVGGGGDAQAIAGEIGAATNPGFADCAAEGGIADRQREGGRAGKVEIALPGGIARP